MPLMTIGQRSMHTVQCHVGHSAGIRLLYAYSPFKGVMHTQDNSGYIVTLAIVKLFSRWHKLEATAADSCALQISNAFHECNTVELHMPGVESCDRCTWLHAVTCQMLLQH